MAAFSTIALASLAVAGTAQAINQGEQQKKQQKRALRDQDLAQRRALDLQITEQLRADQALRAANRQQPDPLALLAAEQEAATKGAGSTLLTGKGGVDPSRLRLGRQSLLGG